MLREIAYAVLGLVLALYAADLALGLGDDAREPPRLRARVPLVGHLLGLMRHGVSYFSETSARAGGGVEMYSLGILHYKMYICNSNRLMPFIQKSARTVSFKPFMQTAVRSHGGGSDHAYEVFGDGAFLDKYSHGSMFYSLRREASDILTLVPYSEAQSGSGPAPRRAEPENGKPRHGGH